MKERPGGDADHSNVIEVGPGQTRSPLCACDVIRRLWYWLSLGRLLPSRAGVCFAKKLRSTWLRAHRLVVGDDGLGWFSVLIMAPVGLEQDRIDLLELYQLRQYARQFREEEGFVLFGRWDALLREVYAETNPRPSRRHRRRFSLPILADIVDHLVKKVENCGHVE